MSERSGILLALSGFTMLSCGDAVIKTMAGEWSPIAVAALRFAIGAAGLSFILLKQEGLRGFRPSNPWLQIARGASLAGATLCFFCAVFLMPLAEAMAIALTGPMLVAVLSGPLLGERVRPSVWVACGIALVGVSFVLRPNIALLGWAALLPLASALFFAFMVIANRASAGQGSALSMQAFIALIAAPLLWLAAILGRTSDIGLLAVTWPDWTVIARCALVAVTASSAHWLVYLATTRAGASTIAPLTYVQMLVATAIGWAAFGEVPDLLSIVGAMIILAAGLLLWWTTPVRAVSTIAAKG